MFSRYMPSVLDVISTFMDILHSLSIRNPVDHGRTLAQDYHKIIFTFATPGKKPSILQNEYITGLASNFP